MADVSPMSGGPYSNFQQYINALIQNGVECEIRGLRDPRLSEVEAASLWPILRCTTFKKNWHGRIEFSFGAVFWFLKNINNYNVIHCVGLMNIFTSVIGNISSVMRRPLVFTLNGNFSKRAIASRHGRLKKFWIRTVDKINFAHGSCHVESVEEMSDLLDCIPQYSRKIAVIPPIIDMPKNSYCEDYVDRHIVLSASRIHPTKNLEMILECWPSIAAIYPDAQLWIIGDGSQYYVENIRIICSKLQHDGYSVRMFGWLNRVDLYKHLRQASLFVAVSSYESFGRSAYEALAAGIPCIVSENMNIKKFVEENNLGKVCHHDIGSLSASIIELLADRCHRRSIKFDAPKVIGSQFSSAIVVQQLIAMYISAFERSVSD